MLELDHFAVLGETLDEAAAHVERALGVPMVPGGQHERYGTHNRLLGLAPALYLEAIAIDPTLAPPKGARWFGLDHFAGAPRLDKWVLRCPDMDAALRALPMAGAPVRLERGDLAWTMAVPEDGLLPFDGLFPALIEWRSPVPPGKTLAAPGLTLEALTVSHPEAEALRDLLAPHMAPGTVSFETGAPALRVTIATPAGTVTLT
ncbi:VOC family protein [Citreimonas sp.]|uniref:VOC family protein n=1 Tax=Citreimonas sp. TaxID=3036715 RepID=UPI0035C8135B